ncbi:MAG: ABC transporter substrate-binding protein [Desulfobacteraceae bacterium]|jgi:peptide/nickel transport system substrate-binding protein|nr:ABC transporter substrate-binding protein [Desulfobacteraceae bacterium]
MRKKTLFLVLLLSAAIALPAGAKTLRFAFQGDVQSMDPYNLNETFHLGFWGNIYEGLIRRGPNLEIEPALAERWEVMEPTRWRFYLRKGVKFHDGTPFTADDVVFSATRVRHPDSDLRVRISADTKVVKVDDHTVDFVTEAPNPILPNEWSTWYIMSKSWTEKHDAVTPQSATKKEENYATRHANGTGPFILVSQEPGVKTVCKVNPDWWDNPNKIHNVTEVIFTQISNDATRVAALLSGQVDMAYPIPVQDMKRVDDNAATRMMVGPELRTIFLGMDQFRDELLYSNVKGKNPFKDKRVRQAFYQAIDIEAIKKKVMRGLSEPSAMMVAPGVHGGGNPKFKRLEYDPAAAKRLLAEAGYPDGFEVGMDCPNNRYVNDEQICLATVSMLAKVGIKVNLLAQPKSKYFGKILAPKRDTSFYLLGWTPSSFDSYNPLNFLHHCPKDTGEGKFNLGGFCNPEVDKLTAKINSETDQAKRDALIEQAWTMTIDDVAHIPLHQQALAWGVNNKVQLKQRPDNEFKWRHVKIE